MLEREILGPNGQPLMTTADLLESLNIKDLELRESETNRVWLQEQLAELELAPEDVGWLRIGDGSGYREFSREALKKLTRLARLFYLKNPLVKNGARIMANYVWGLGCNFSSPNPEIQKVINAFLADKQNKKVLTGHRARWLTDVDLTVESNIFLALFINESTGWIKLSKIHSDEIDSIVTDPQNKDEVWYYKRVWTQFTFDTVTGQNKSAQMEEWYPDYAYAPDDKPSTINGKPVRWESPIYHIKWGHLSDMRFGIPDVYAAIDWARAVKDDLEDYATTKRALATFAWKLTRKGGARGIADSKAKFSTTFAAGGGSMMEHNPPPTKGAMWLQSEGAGDLTPIKTAGMTPSPEDGQRLWLMVCAAMGVPETMLAGNADIGNYATSKTLDRPTELNFENRQALWTDVYKDLFNFLIDCIVKAPNGILKGQEVDDEYTGDKVVVLRSGPTPTQTGTDLVTDTSEEEADRTVKVDFPPLLEHDLYKTMQSIQIAAGLQILPPEVIARQVAAAFGESDVEAILVWVKKYFATAAAASQAQAGNDTAGGGQDTGGGTSGGEGPTPGSSSNINDSTLNSSTTGEM